MEITVKYVEQLKAKVAEANRKIADAKARKSVALQSAKEILAKYGIEDIKDWKRIYEIRDGLKAKAEEEILRVESKLQEATKIFSDLESELL